MPTKPARRKIAHKKLSSEHANQKANLARNNTYLLLQLWQKSSWLSLELDGDVAMTFLSRLLPAFFLETSGVGSDLKADSGSFLTRFALEHSLRL